MFDWEDYWDLASYINQNKNKIGLKLEEACMRDVISRTYYAAYGVAHKYFRGKDRTYEFIREDGTKASEHVATSEWFRTRDDRELYKIGEYLVNLFTRRLKADYNDMEYKNSIELTDSVIKSSHIIDYIKPKLRE